MSYNNSSSGFAGKKPASFSLFYGSTQGEAKNTSYPFKRVISSLDKLVQVATCDHVGCRFRAGKNNRGTLIKAYRSNGTFYSADVIIMDVDNVSANPLDPDLTEADWMTPANVAAAFPDVPFYVVYSRHHMQEKNGRSPRPKFHVYFPLYREITDYMELEDLKRKVQRMFPAFDPNAIKVTQFMFGVPSPKAEYYDGNTRIDQFVKNDEKLPEVIQEGHRNETLSKYAGKVITRLGDTKKAREAFDKAADKCCPPLDSEELNTIWRSAQSFFHTTVETSKGYVEPDDYETGGGDKKKNGFTVGDLREILKQLGISIRYNIILRESEITGLPTGVSSNNSNKSSDNNSVAHVATDNGSDTNSRKVADADDDEGDDDNDDETALTSVLLGYMSQHGFHCSNRAFDAHLATIIKENRYNPIQEMLDETVWDKKDRITELLDLVMRVQETDKIYVIKWLHQCIAMALNGTQASLGNSQKTSAGKSKGQKRKRRLKPYGADGVLVLQGDQGIGKTMLCSKLAVYDEWFMEGVSIDMGNKDTIIQATASWIAELGELDSTLKREQSVLKAFLTAKKDVFRLPYARSATKNPRRTSFCATVNPQKFLNDETGSRRFWVIDASHIDTSRVEALDEEWAMQLWRQVYETLYLPNPQGFRLTRAEQNQLRVRNEAYIKPMAGETELLDKLNFDAPKEDWVWRRVTDLMEAIGAKSIGAVNLGKAINNLMKHDNRIEEKTSGGRKLYLLPPLMDKVADNYRHEDNKDRLKGKIKGVFED